MLRETKYNMILQWVYHPSIQQLSIFFSKKTDFVSSVMILLQRMQPILAAFGFLDLFASRYMNVQWLCRPLVLC